MITFSTNTKLIFISAISSFAFYYLSHSVLNYCKKRKTKSSSTSKVLFFPDIGNSRNLRKLIYEISNAKKSIDLCLYLFTSSQLSDAIIKNKSKSLKIRMITDQNMATVSGTQIPTLQRFGAFIRMNNNNNSVNNQGESTNGLMHHKFAIIDDRILISGSFNWTTQALNENFENIIITDDKKLIRQFKQEFEKLWLQFEKKN